MTTVTLEQIHQDLIEIREDIEYIKTMIEEDLELSDEVIKEIEESRKRSNKDFISHEEMRKEFS